MGRAFGAGKWLLPRFWSLNEYRDLILGKSQNAMAQVPDLVTDDSLRQDLKGAEKQRITYRRRPEDADALDCEGVVSFIERAQGPRLLIVNTVQTAAAIAQAIRRSGNDVLHLSTALAPAHRDLIVDRIKRRLRDKIDDWTLVATSCVEAGMDFSFRTGFRERASTASLIQIGGRISRGAEYFGAEVWDLLLRDHLFRDNPSMTVSRRALGYFGEDELCQANAPELATTAMRREWTSGAEERAKRLIEFEDSMEYPAVSKECRVIDADTRTVLIDQSLADVIRKGKKISKNEVMRYSVQLWTNKVEKLALEPVIQDAKKSSDMGIYSWPYEYDPDFLGYMKGALKLEEFIAAGGAII